MKFQQYIVILLKMCLCSGQRSSVQPNQTPTWLNKSKSNAVLSHSLPSR